MLENELDLKLTPPWFAILLRDATGVVLLRGAGQLWLPLFTDKSKAREFLVTPGLAECLIYRLDDHEQLAAFLHAPPSRSPSGSQYYDLVVIDPAGQRETSGLIVDGLTGYRPEQFHLPINLSVPCLFRDRYYYTDPHLIRTARRMLDLITTDLDGRPDIYVAAGEHEAADLPKFRDTPLSLDWAEDLNEKTVHILRMMDLPSGAYAQIALTQAEVLSQVHLRVRVFQLRSMLFRHGVDSLRRSPVEVGR